MATNTTPRDDVQINLGDYSRISGRDYIEINAPDSIKMFLATTSSAELDERAIDNEYLFRYRFGFFANRPIRAHIIAIKTEHGLTDEELRSLRHAGQLSIKRREAKIAPDHLMPAVGWIYAILLSVVSAVCCIAISSSSAPGWKQGLGLMMVCAFWLTSIWFVSKVHITPWRLLKQVGVVGRMATASNPTK